MDISKYKVKPVKVEIRGEELEMKPLRTKHYLIVSKYQYLAMKAKDLAEYNKKNNTKKELSKEEREELINLDVEIAYLTLSEMFKDLTKEDFDELPMEIISEIMGKFWEINNPNYEEDQTAKKELLRE